MASNGAKEGTNGEEGRKPSGNKEVSKGGWERG